MGGGHAGRGGRIPPSVSIPSGSVPPPCQPDGARAGTARCCRTQSASIGVASGHNPALQRTRPVALSPSLDCIRLVQSLTRRLATADRLPWPQDPIPVTLVITDLDVGGAERALVALATRLDRRRWRPSVIALGLEGALAGPLRDSGIDT